MSSSPNHGAPLGPEQLSATSTGNNGDNNNSNYPGAATGARQKQQQLPAATVSSAHYDQGYDADDAEEIIAALRADNAALRQYSSRCDAELRLYQAQFPALAHSIAVSFRSSPLADLPQECVDAALASPLLDAYARRLEDVTAARDRADAQVAALRGQMADALAQYDILQRQLAEITTNPPSHSGGGGNSDGGGGFAMNNNSGNGGGLSAHDSELLLAELTAVQQRLDLVTRSERAAAERLTVLTPAHAQATERVAALEATVTALQKELTAAAVVHGQAEQRLAVLSKDARRLQARVEDGVAAAARLGETEHVLAAAQARAGALEAAAQHEADRALASEARVAELTAEIVAKTEECETLRRHVAAALAQAEKAREAEVRAVYAGNAEAQRATQEATARKCTEQEVAALKAQIEAARLDHEKEFNRVLAAAAADVAEQAQKHAILKSDADKATTSLHDQLTRAVSERDSATATAADLSHALARVSQQRDADALAFRALVDQAQARATTAAAHEEEAGECAARAAREAQALRARLDRERGVWEEERNRIVAALTQAQAEAAAAQQDAANAKATETQASEALREHTLASEARTRALAGQLALVTTTRTQEATEARARQQQSESELAALAAQAADLSAKQDALLAQSASALESTVVRAKEHVKSEIAARARAEALLRAAEAEAAALRERQDEAAAVAEQSEREAVRAKAALAAAEQSAIVTKARMRKMEDAHRELVHAHADLAARCDSLEHYLRTAESQRDAAIRVARAVSGGGGSGGATATAAAVV